MKISTLFYTIRQGFRNMFRNKWFTLASIATIAACLFLFGLFYAVILNFSNIIKTAEEGVSVTVFFDEGTDENTMEVIGDEIEQRPEVDHVVFVSADEAWESFKEDYLGEYADGFTENPLAESAHYEIYLNDISMQPALVTYLENREGIRQVNKSEVTATTLTGVNALVAYVSAAIILILLLVSIFLISNTVTIGIAVRKEEINIMKYVGATNGFIRLPFVVEGLVLGILGGGLAFLAEWGIYTVLTGKLIGSLTGSFITVVPFSSLAMEMFIAYMGTSILVGIFGALNAIRNYLKV